MLVRIALRVALRFPLALRQGSCADDDGWRASRSACSRFPSSWRAGRRQSLSPLRCKRSWHAREERAEAGERVTRMENTELRARLASVGNLL